jgi:hypothetical protein
LIAHPTVARYLERNERHPLPQEANNMATPSKQGEEQAEDKAQVSTQRLERLANVATAADRANRWQSRKDGLLDLGEPSEVRNLSHDAEARAQAEAAMQQMMAKSAGKRRGR